MDSEFFAWLLFTLFFSLIPLKSLFNTFLIITGYQKPKDTTPIVEEEGELERHYSQLYRPGDRKYQRIVELSEKAKPVQPVEKNH